MEFFDRKTELEFFDSYLKSFKQNGKNVLVFYGMAGVGKTALLNELQCRIQKENDYFYASLNFDWQYLRTEVNALSYLSNMLKLGFGLNFFSFELALAIYLKKLHPQIKIDDNKLPFIEETGLISDIISVASEIPFIGVIPKVIKAISKVDEIISKWWIKRGKLELAKLSKMNPYEINKTLSHFWISDIKEELIDNKRNGIIFLDTYDALWEHQKTNGGFFRIDEWIRKLTSELPQILWVIFSREKLRWIEIDNFWDEKIFYKLLLPFKKKDSDSFLIGNSFNDEKLRNILIEKSKGIPLILNLYSDINKKIAFSENRKPEEEDFVFSNSLLIDNFLRFSDKTEVRILEILSVLRHWNKVLFEIILKKFSKDIILNLFDSIISFSFIVEDSNKNSWGIHELLRNSLYNRLGDSMKIEIHNFLFEYYNNNLSLQKNIFLSDDFKKSLTEAFYHGKSGLIKSKFFDWFDKTYNFLIKYGYWEIAASYTEELVSYTNSDSDTKEFYCESLHKLAKLYYFQGRFVESENIYLKELDIKQKIYGEENPEIVSVMNGVASLYVSTDRIDKAENLFCKSIQILNKIKAEHKNKYWRDLATSLSNLSVVYYYLDKHNKAIRLARKGLSLYETNLPSNQEDIVPVLNSLAIFYAEKNWFEDSEKMHKRALEIRINIYGKIHPDVSDSLNNLGTLYHRMGIYPLAKIYYEKALKIRQLTLGLEHPHVASSLHNIAIIYRLERKYLESKKYYKKSLKLKKKLFGTNHASVATTIASMATLYYYTKEFKKSERLYFNSLSIYRMKRDEVNSDIAIVLNGLGSLYCKQNRLTKAQEFLEKAYKIRVKIYGKKHLFVGESLLALGDLSYKKFLFMEAEQSYLNAFKIYEKNLMYRDMVTTLNKLLRIYIKLNNKIKLDNTRNELKKYRSLNIKQIKKFTLLSLKEIKLEFG